MATITLSENLTVQGNSGIAATAKGAFTTGNLIKSDINGNFIDAGISGVGGGGGGVVSDAINRIFNVFNYGAVGDGTTDDTTAIQNTINAAQAISTYPYGPRARVYAPEGYVFKVTGNLAINSQVNVDFRSNILDYGTTGDLITICKVAPSPYMNWCNIFFQGLLSQPGNTTVPSSCNLSGRTAFRINAAAFCRFHIQSIQGFTKYGIYLDGLGDVFAPQVVQHNNFDLGQITNCGIGIFLDSLDGATSSAEANRFNIQDINQCWINLQIDDATHSVSNSNRFIIDAMDTSAPNSQGGHGGLVYGSCNLFDLTYLGTDFYFGPTSSHNTINVYNPASTGGVIWQGGTSNHYNVVT